MKKKELLTECCVCKKIKIDNKWIDKVPSSKADNMRTHGYCPKCYTKVLLQISEMPVRELAKSV